MNMSLRANYRRRVLANSLVIASTLLTCSALRADHEDKDQSAAQGAPGQYEKGEKHGDKAQNFIKEAAQGGQMEVRMGQLGQQKGQNQEVKSLAATLVRDHTQANQKLQQLAQKKGITLDQSTDQKHQKHLDKLQSQSGAEFDKAFVQHAIKDHKKDIAKFEKCQKDIQDAELKAFIDETLPTLRNHLQMAQNAARAVGVDANVAADIDDDSDTSSGAPATGVSGTREENRSSSSLDKPQSSTSSSSSSSSLNGATETDSSLTINQNNPSAKIEGNIGDRQIKANADVDTSDASARTDVSTDENGNKIFQKGDGKVLGLSTGKGDGKFLGIIPNPRNDSSSAEVTAESDTSSGGPAVSASGSARSNERINLSAAPTAVQHALQSEGVTSTTSIKRMTVYEADVNGKKIHVTEDGKVYKHDSSSSSSR